LSDGWKKEIYRDVRYFHGALHLHFGGDIDHDMDPGIFKGIFTIVG